jgi:hypothetical protein
MRSKVISNLGDIISNRFEKINVMKCSTLAEIFDCLSKGIIYNPEYPIVVIHPAPDFSEGMEIIGVLTGKQMSKQNLFPNNELDDSSVYVYGREYIPYDMSGSQAYDDPVLAEDLYIEELLFILEKGFKDEILEQEFKDEIEIKITVNKDGSDGYLDIDVEC